MKVSESISRKVTKIWKNMESIEPEDSKRSHRIWTFASFFSTISPKVKQRQTSFLVKTSCLNFKLWNNVGIPFPPNSPPDGPVLQVGRIQQDYHRYHSSIWNIWNMKVIYHVMWTMWHSLSYELYPMDFFCHMDHVVNMMCIIRYIHCIAYTSHIALLM